MIINQRREITLLCQFQFLCLTLVNIHQLCMIEQKWVMVRTELRHELRREEINLQCVGVLEIHVGVV